MTNKIKGAFPRIGQIFQFENDHGSSTFMRVGYELGAASLRREVAFASEGFFGSTHNVFWGIQLNRPPSLPDEKLHMLFAFRESDLDRVTVFPTADVMMSIPAESDED